MSQPPNTSWSYVASGTKSRIAGDRPSVRLPSRIVPISVSDPMGLAMPFRIAMIPAMVVVETAPRPTSRIPSFPLAGLIDIACVTAENYIIRVMFRWSTMFRPFPNLRRTAVAMIDPRPGDAILFVGADDPALAGECGAVAGLNGRAVVVDANASMASRVEAAAVSAGALVEFTAAAPPTLPFATGTFAVVV